MWSMKTTCAQRQESPEDLHNECLSRQTNMSAMLDSLNEMSSAVSERFALVASSEDAAMAHERMQDVRNELLSWATKIEENIAEADRLCTEGAEMLTPEQFHALKERRNRLETTYNQLVRHTDSVLQRLSELTKLLLEFSNDSSSMHSFINEKTRELSILRAESGDPQTLAESRCRVKALTEEVSASETRLKGVSSLAARIQSELDGYIVEMRVQYPDAQIPSADAHELINTLTRLQADYELLVRGCQDLIAFLNRLNSLAVTHAQNVDTVSQSLCHIENQILQAEKTAIGSDVTADSSTMSEMLKRMEELQHDSLEHAARIESALRSANELSSALVGTDAHQRIALENQRQLDDFQRRQSRNKERIEENIDSWRSKIARNEGIRKGMSTILDWLDKEEKRVALPRQLPLSIEKLAEMRREEELALRELSSQQMVLTELGGEISRTAAESPSSAAGRSLVEQLQKAQKKFTPLVAVTKARGENISELSAAVVRIGNAEKALNEKLMTLGERLAYVAPSDTDSLGAIRAELSAVLNDDWKSIQKQHKWILAVPDVTECDSLNRSMDKVERTLDKMSTRLNELSAQGEALGSQRKAFDELHAETVSWLEAIEKSAQDLDAISLNPVELANQRNACAILQSEHQEHRIQLEQLEDLGSKLVEIETMARMKLKGNSGKSEEAQSTLRELSAIWQRYDALGAQLKSRSDKINTNSEKLAEWDLARDELARWAVSEARRLEGECPVALTHDDIQSNISKADRVEKLCKKEKQPLMEGVRAKARHLLSDLSVPGAAEVQTAQTALERDWQTLASMVDAVKEKNELSKKLIQGCEHLDKWLRQKERMMSVIGTINVDPKVINNQLIQIELLSGEMDDQTALRTKVNELAHSLITSSPSDSHSQGIVEMMDGLNLRWVAFQEGLETKKGSLLKAKETSMQFSNLQRDIRSALLEVAEEVEEASRWPLTNAPNFEEHVAKLDKLGAKSVEASARLDQLKKLAEVISGVVDDAAIQSDIREQLNVTSQTARELNRKIESLKSAAMSAKAEEGQTAKETENILKWMKDVKGQLADVGPISADSRILDDQSKLVDEIYRSVLDKEGDVTLLRAKLAEQMRKTPNAPLKANLDVLNAEWNPLLEEAKVKRASVERVSDLVGQLNMSLDSFTRKTEQNKASLQALVNAKGDEPLTVRELEKQVERQHVELNALETLVHKLEDISAGPSTNHLKRRVENALDDWNALSKEVRNTVNKAQHKKDMRGRFEKCKEEAIALLNAARESCGVLGASSSDITGPTPHVTKESLSKALSEFETNWQRQNRELSSAAKDLQGVVDREEAKALEVILRELDAECHELTAGMRNACGEIERKDQIVDCVKRKISALSAEVLKITEDDMTPVGCDLNELELQKKQCSQLLEKLLEKEQEAEELAAEWKRLCASDCWLVNACGAATVLQHLNDLNEQFNKGRASVAQRKRTISNTQQAVLDVQKEIRATCADLDELMGDETVQEPVKSELSELRAQQEKVRIFRDKVRPLGQRVEQAITNCENMIKCADKNVNTASLECERDKLADVWNEINGRLADREKLICSAMQELGSYSDAHNALLVWLQDTEESLANQRPPSTEHKVVKEQTRANDILLKHIEEKQQSVDGFKTMIENVTALATDEAHRLALKETSDNVTQRYATLLESAHARRARLHEALVLAEEWSQAAAPLRTWLDATEKSLQQLGKVPTDEEKLQKQIRAHQMLQEDINGKRWEFDRLVELCPRLAELTSVEEAAELDVALRSLTSRYENLGSRATECGVLLQQMAEEIGSFLEHTNTLSEWLDRIEDDIYKIDSISIYPEELIEQSSLLTELAMAVTEQEALVSTVVEDGRELCRQTTGDEAIALQSRIEALRTRYTELASVTDSKIAVLSEALPLSERFHDGCETVQQWMDAVEQDMHNIDQVPLEAQSALIAQMEDDLEKWREDVEKINGISKQLQQLSSGPRADELSAQTDDLNRRFNMLAEQVARKAEKLTSAEKQSRQVLDELDYLNEWFADARDRLMQASAPAVDPDYVKKQLKNQKQMNEDIAVMKARLRDAAADAQKVTRALGDEASGQDSLLASKIESGRALSADAAQMGEERLGELEQALALCQEVDQSFGELHAWLEKIENEIDNCPSVSTGNQRDQLMKQQEHNADLQHSIQAQRPLMDRFNKNVNALRELCDSEDAVQLEKIAEGIEERFEGAREAVRQRAEALETAIEHSSQFTDRLDVILANLGGAAAQIRHPDPVSADPERIRSQICDNMALMEELRHKEGALRSVKESAREILEQARPNDAAVTDIEAKLDTLDSLWQELYEGVTMRGSVLEETLKKAERFWTELERCQKAVDELRSKIDGIQPATGQPSLIEQQRSALMVIEAEMSGTEPMMSDLRVAGRDLCEVVADEERAHVEQQIGVVEGSWATVTDMFARKNVDLVDAMEKAMDFHGLLSELVECLNETEKKVSTLAPVSSASPNDIQNELEALEQLRSTLDEKAIQKEQLNQLCANLCVGVNSHQSATIRAPISDLNSRWNRLYASLNERQQKMERALLEMGQFSQAYEQLMGWIEKTEHVLDEIDPHPTNLKQVEIEVCKHKVIQNDVLMHETSVDTVKAAAKRIIAVDQHSTAATQPMIDDLNARWHTLVDKLEDVWEQLTEARKAAENLGGEMDRWSLWLQDKDADLSHSKPCGGLPETAHAQLDDFLVLKAEIEQNRLELEAHLEASEKYLQDNVGNKDTWVAQREAQLKKKWLQVQEKMVDREQKLRIALAEAEQLHSAMSAMTEWLDSADARLGRMEPISRIPDTLEKQMNAQAEFHTEVYIHRELMSDINSKGTKLQYYCEKKDAIPIKNLLVTAKHRFDKVVSRSADRTKQLDLAFQEARLFFDAQAELGEWIASSKKWLDEQSGQATFGERVRGDLERHKDFQHELAGRQPMYDATYRRGKSLSEHAPRAESSTISQMNEQLREKWTQLCNSSVQRQRVIEEALLACGQFDEALSSLREWLEKELPGLQAADKEPVYGDLDTVNQLIEEHQALMNAVEARQASLQSVRQRAEQMLSGKEEGDESVAGLREKLDQLNSDWTSMERLANNKNARLKEALASAESFNNDAHTFLDWLPRIEARLRMKGRRAEGEVEILEQMDDVVQLRKEMDDEASRLEAILKSGKEIYAKCHPLAEQPMKCWLRILQTRWDEVSQSIDSKRDGLETQLTELREQDELIAELMKFITAKDAELRALNDTQLPTEVELIERLVADHEAFEFTLRERQSEVDDATKGRKKPASDDSLGSKSIRKSVAKRERPIRHPKSDQLSDRWKKLWVDSMEYGRRLREMKEYLDEMKKLESFTFEEWRERYLEWTDSGKARISDLFRRIDKSGTGRVPRSAFIDGIIASKFPTTRLEMEKVANEFDKGDGMIDAKEFMARLRSDFAKKLPTKQKTDGEKISEEVIRQSERCSCHSPYKIQKVGEGHYRFGDTQIKRMVRILRSTVMVRVGGGWVALDEFLHKHDPCRAKGRTNIEMQRGFYDDVRPEGAFDTMKTFTKSSRSTPNRDISMASAESLIGQSRFSSTPGPITKIREKTERSMPMYSVRRTSAVSRGSPSDTPHSTRRPSDVNTHDSKIARPVTPTNVSRSGSRGDMLELSRPGSRCSEASESSERPTRIPSLRGKKGVGCRVSRASPSSMQ